ncbi:MAG: hypothetical protein H0T11_04750 [Chthoniobacterales bacterium]|nr:hypothetical protein [Chthoniobacterales bacterium]
MDMAEAIPDTSRHIAIELLPTLLTPGVRVSLIAHSLESTRPQMNIIFNHN